MTQLLQSLAMIEFGMGADGKPPSEFRMFRKGPNASTKGTFEFSDESARQCMASMSKGGRKLPIDYEHASYSAKYAVDPAKSGEAAGFMSLAVRDGELWATKCTWTKEAQERLSHAPDEAPKYAYFSPMFDHTESGEIMSIVNCALTNNPALMDISPLTPLSMQQHLSKSPTQEPRQMETLLAMLNVSPKASEAEAVTALNVVKGQTGELLRLCEASTVAEAAGKVLAWKRGCEAAAELSKQIEAANAAAAKAELTALLDKGITDGKVTPAEKTFLGELSLEQLKAYLAVKPKVVQMSGAGEKKPAAAGGTAALTAEEAEVAKQLGRDPEKFAAALAAAKTKYGPIGKAVLGERPPADD